MFRILVADDEKITRKGIVAMLQRGLQEEIECIEAGNGQEALEIVTTQMIHLIITDICMPLCSGLEFVEQLRKNDSDMTVVIISGYENFDYAKQAVRLGVKDYITKPIQKDAFLGLIESCLADIRKRQMEVMTEYEKAQKHDRIAFEVKKERLSALLYGQDIEKSLKRLSDLDISFQAPFYFPAVIEYEINDGVEECIDFVVSEVLEEYIQRKVPERYLPVSPKKGQTVLIFGIYEIARRDAIIRILADAAALLRQQIHAKVMVGIGPVTYDIRRISAPFDRACHAADMKIFQSGRMVIRYEEAAADGQKLSEGSLFRKINSETMNAILKEFSDLFRQKPEGETLAQIKNQYIDFCKAFDEKRLRHGWEDPPARHSFDEFWSEYELRHDLKEMLQYVAVNENKKEQQEEQKTLIHEITEYTLEHLTEEINLNYVAEYFGKTSGYVGALFRRSKQMGFNEFVTQKRMEMAKHMLRDTTISVQEVSERCGYYNTKYFSVMFKKTFGISPKSYQMKRGEL